MLKDSNDLKNEGENLQRALKRIDDFVHGNSEQLWENLCACKPGDGISLVDDLGIECSYDQRVNRMWDRIRQEFLMEFEEITVSTRTVRDGEKAKTWYEYQKTGFWTKDKYLKIVEIVKRVAADCL